MAHPPDTNPEPFVYDPNDPSNVADRANDPDDGIDYDEIIMTTEADFRAGRGRRFSSMLEVSRYLDELFERAMTRRSNRAGKDNG